MKGANITISIIKGIMGKTLSINKVETYFSTVGKLFLNMYLALLN